MSKQPIYGFPCVTDPHDFSPDYESCSPAEIEAHRLACANYGTPTYQPHEGCYTVYDELGQTVTHVLRTSWGIGVNLVSVCDKCGTPPLNLPLMTCRACGEREYCEFCWPEHEKRHNKEKYR